MIIDYITKALLLVTPIVYMTGFSQRITDERFFLLGVMAIGVASFFQFPVRRIHGRTLLGTLLGLAIFSVIAHKFNIMVTGGAVNILLGVMAFALIFQGIKHPERFYKYIVGAAVINMAMYGLQKIGYTPIFGSIYGDGSHPAEFGGFMGNTPRLVMLLTISLPFLFKVHPVLAAPAIFISIIEKELCLLPIAMLLCIRETNKIIGGVVLISSIIALGFISKIIASSLLLRWEVWEGVITGFFTHPIIGYGVGVLPSPKVLATMTEDPTIMGGLLQFCVTFGIGGIIWLGFALKEFGKKFDLSNESIAVLAILWLMIFEYPFEVKRLWFLIIVVIVMYALKKKEGWYESCLQRKLTDRC